ncbi:hypothetical protein ACVR0A_08345 [Streptococcus downei]|uniref:Uncharacterized protein n=1 Tax=Streptococcus downei MFe28 TaxID=764290 RepID=A0A380JAV9_STRDO|nr:hypothetical protein [Streptococcus downei]EFQ57280.1 hypothetical protein HMPREF9176_0830 [Streptococcus downei F0415]SUN35151.1 Uncharacterised protein [Streptococcus downei MFe28]
MESNVFDKFESVQTIDLSKQIGGSIVIGYDWGLSLARAFGNLYKGGFSGGGGGGGSFGGR